MNKLLLIALLSVAQAMYEHQIGLHDWVIRQFGELEKVDFQYNINFKSKQNVGTLSKQTGQILNIHEGDFVQCDSSIYAYFDSVQQRVSIYNQTDNTHKFITKFDQQLKACFIRDNLILVGADSQFEWDGNVLSQTKFRQGFTFAASSSNSYLTQSDKKLCLHDLHQERQCKQRVQNIVPLIDGFLAYDDKNVYLIRNDIEDLSKTYAQLLTQKGQVFDSGTLFVASIDGHQIIYKIQPNQEPQLLKEFPRGAVFDLHLQGKDSNLIYFTLQEGKLVKIYLFDATTQVETLLGQIQTNTESKPLRVFTQATSGKKHFLIQHRDLHTYLFSQHEQQTLWSNEQSLQNLTAVLWGQFPDEEQMKHNSYFESLEKHGSKNPLYMVQHLVLRFSNDFYDLVSYLESVPNRLQKFVTEMTQLRIKGGTTAAQRAESKVYDITYGLRQKIIVITRLKTILCFDSESGELLWKETQMLDRMDSSFQLKGHYEIEYRLFQIRLRNVHRDSEDSIPLHHVLIYYSDVTQKLNIYTLNPETGDLFQVAQQRSSQITQITSYRVQTESGSSHDNLIIILNQDGELITYPRVPLDIIGLDRAPILFYNLEGRQITGYSFINGAAEPLWNFKIGSSEEVLKIRSSYSKGEDNPRIALWDDLRVLFKVIDFSNFAVITKDNEKGYLNLYIINAKSGKLLFQGIQKEIDFTLPINLVYDENSVFVTYFNPSKSIFEIWAIELFHEKIEDSFVSILTDYYLNQKEETQLNYYLKDIECVFLQKKYGYPLGIKSLQISKTRKSLTKRNLLIITPSDQVHSLDRNSVSSRRKIMKGPENPFESKELPPYLYLLPTNMQTILNYHQELSNLNSFYIQPTNLESTSLLLLNGDDLFFTRISPDRTYDMIQPDFNYNLLLLTVALIIGIAYVAREYAKDSRVLKAFYNS